MERQCDLMTSPVKTRLNAHTSETHESKAGLMRSFCGLGYARR